MYFATGASLTAAIAALPTATKGNYKAFDDFYYAQLYMGSYSGGLSPIEHFVQIGAARGNKPNADFDPAYYKALYADLKNTSFDGADLLYHYVASGLNEGRLGNATLAGASWTGYMTAYPDVATYVNANLASFGGSATNGAVAHYAKFGQYEGRAVPGGPSSGQTFTLTTGVDVSGTIKGDLGTTSTTGNDTFNATETTLTGLDTLNGGAGTDTLNIVDASLTPYTLPVTLVSISGIENLSISHTANAAAGTDEVIANVSTLTDMRSVTVSNLGSTPDITITGSANLTSVTIGGASGIATVADSGTATTDKIATITLVGVTGVGTLSSDALTTLNLTSTGAAVTNTDSVTTDARTLTVNFLGGTNVGAVDAGATTVNVLTGGSTASVLGASSVFAAATTLNYTANTALTSGTVTAGEALTVNATANAVITATTLATAKATTVNVAANAAITAATLGAATTTALNLSGSSAMTLTQTVATAGVITSTGTGARTLVTAIGTAQLYVGGDGVDTITVTGSNTKAITTGAGNDVVTTDGIVGTGGSLNAGDGTGDTVVMTGAQAATAGASATFNSKFTNFEILSLTTDAGTNVVDLSGVNGVSKVTAIGQTNVTLNTFASGGTLTFTGASVAAAIGVTGAAGGVNDVVNLDLAKTAAGIVAYGSVTAANVETINITSNDKVTAGSTAAIDTLTLVATSAKTVTVAGNNGLNLTNTGNVAITSFDASGVVANGVADTAALLAVTFLSANTTAAAAVSITGGAGADILAGNAANVDTIVGGLGNDIIIGDASAEVQTITIDAANTAAGTGTYTILGVAVTTTETTTMSVAAKSALAVTNINATAALAGRVVASGTTTVILTYAATEGNASFATYTTTSTVGGGATVAVGTNVQGALGAINTKADILTGSAGSDVFHYSAGTGNTTVNVDTIIGLDLGTLSTAVDTVVFSNAGATKAVVVLSTAQQATVTASSTFANAVDNAFVAIAADGATGLFTYGGETYLLHNGDGNATWTDAADYVVKVTGVTGTLDTGDFTVN
jgi:S-layer protein